MAGEHPAALTAAEAARRIREGLLSSEELVEGCLERIRQVEPEVRAWQFLDEKHAHYFSFERSISPLRAST